MFDPSGLETLAGSAGAGVMLEPLAQLVMHRLPKAWRAPAVIAAAAVATTVHAVGTGLTWKQAILNTVVMGGTAIYKHDSKPSNVALQPKATDEAGA